MELSSKRNITELNPKEIDFRTYSNLCNYFINIRYFYEINLFFIIVFVNKKQTKENNNILCCW